MLAVEALCNWFDPSYDIVMVSLLRLVVQVNTIIGDIIPLDQ